MSLLLFSFLFVCCSAQLTPVEEPLPEYPCFFDGRVPTPDQVKTPNKTIIAPIIEAVTNNIESQLEGLSTDEAAEQIFSALQKANNDLFQGALDGEPEPSFDGVTVSDYTVALFDGLYDVDNGQDLIIGSLQTDSQGFIDFVIDFLDLVDFKQTGCFDDTSNTYISIWVALMLNILQEPLRDEIASIGNQTIVYFAYRYDQVDRYRNVVEPLVAAIDRAQSSDIFASLLSTGLDTLVGPIAAAVEDTRYESDNENIAGILTMAIGALQEGLGLAQEDFVDFLDQAFRSVLAALK